MFPYFWWLVLLSFFFFRQSPNPPMLYFGESNISVRASTKISKGGRECVNGASMIPWHKLTIPTEWHWYLLYVVACSLPGFRDPKILSILVPVLIGFAGNSYHLYPTLITTPVRKQTIPVTATLVPMLKTSTMSLRAILDWFTLSSDGSWLVISNSIHPVGGIRIAEHPVLYRLTETFSWQT